MRKHIAAKPTRFAGRRFDSRLEARWALLFQYAGIRWSYHPVTWKHKKTGWEYTPDFRIAGNEEAYFVEIKPLLPNWDYIRQLRNLDIGAPPLVLGVGSFWQETPYIVHPKHVRKRATQSQHPRDLRSHTDLTEFLTILGCKKPLSVITNAKRYRFDI